MYDSMTKSVGLILILQQFMLNVEKKYLLPLLLWLKSYICVET